MTLLLQPAATRGPCPMDFVFTAALAVHPFRFHCPSSDEDFIFPQPVCHHRLLTDVLINTPPISPAATVFIPKNRSSFCHYPAQKLSVVPTAHHILGHAMEGSPPDGLQHLPSQTHPPVLPFTYFPDIFYLLPFPPGNSNYLPASTSACQNLTPIFSKVTLRENFSDSKSTDRSQQAHTRSALTLL